MNTLSILEEDGSWRQRDETTMGNATSAMFYNNYNKKAIHWQGYYSCKGISNNLDMKIRPRGKAYNGFELKASWGGAHHARCESDKPIARKENQKGERKGGENEWMEAT